MDSNLVGKYFAPKVEDSFHKGLYFSSTKGYLDHKLDFVYCRVDIDLP